MLNAASHLKENSEEDDGDRGGDKELLAADVVRESECQGERNCPPQATVGQTELIFHVEGDGAERVDDLSQHQDACRGTVKARMFEDRLQDGAEQLRPRKRRLCLPRPLHTKAKIRVNKM